MLGRLVRTRARLRFSAPLAAVSASCAAFVWYTAPSSMQESTAVATGQLHAPPPLLMDSRSSPHTPLTSFSTASSAVVSSVKRPYAVGDDTLPSPPAPPASASLPQLVQALDAHPVIHEAPHAYHPAALSGAQFAERWVASDMVEDAVLDANADALATDAANPRTTYAAEWMRMSEASASAATARPAHRRGSSVLVSPAPADDSGYITSPPPQRSPNGGCNASTDATGFTSTTAAGLTAHAHVAPASSAQSQAAAGAAHANGLTSKEASAAPLSGLRHSTGSSFSSISMPHTREQLDATPKYHHPQQQQRHQRSEEDREEVILSLRRRLHEAETFAAEQQTRCATATADKEELHRRLTTLMGIEEELERRCQRQQAHAARAEQRRASERRVLELEKAQAIAELTADQERQRHAWEEAATAAQANVEALENEIASLRRALTEAQSELHTALEEQLMHQQRTAAAAEAQASAESECSALRAELAAMQQRATHAEATAEMEELRKQLWGAEERAAAAELALHVVGETLTSAAAAGDSPPVQDSVANPDSSVAAGGDAATTPSTSVSPAQSREARLDEAVVLAAAVAAMERHGVAPPAVSAPASPSKVKEGSSTLIVSPERRTPSTAPSQPEPSTAPVTGPPRLSNAGLLHCRQHQHAVQAALARVLDGQKRAAREATATADARAAEMERIFAQEIAELRARLAEVQAASKAAEPQHCATPSRRASVGVNTASAATLTEVDATAAATPQNGSPYAKGTNSRLSDALLEAQRQLRHEHGYVAQLEKELTTLRGSTYCASVLEGLSDTVQDMRMAVYRLVRDAVADMQRLASDETATMRAVERGSVQGGDSADGLLRRWRQVEQAPLGESGELGGVAVTRTVHRCDPGSLLLDFAFMRGVEHAVLRAEAQVEQVRAKLLPLHFHAQEDEGGHERAPLNPPSQPTTHELLNSHDKRHPAPSHRLVKRALQATNASTPLPSSSCCATAAPAADAVALRQQQRTAQQQQVYDDMRGLLERAARRRHDSDAAAASGAARSVSPSSVRPVTSRYSPNASRWMSGVRPPPPTHLPQAPTGMNISPRSSSSSPYVSAYVQSPAAPHHVGHPAGAAVHPDIGTLIRGMCVSLTDVAQELRSVWHTLEGMRDMEETRAARQRQCLVHWQDVILAEVDDVLRRVETALSTAWRPRSDATVEAPPRNAAQRERDARLVVPIRATLDVPAARADDEAVQDAPQRVHHDNAEPMMPMRHVTAPSRLTDVLSGKASTGAGGSEARISSNAVVFA